MSRAYSSTDIWTIHRAELEALAREARQSRRSVVRHFGGGGGKFFGVASPSTDGGERVRIEWIGPSHSRGEILLSADLQRVTPRGKAVA
jgi:hypothetical protein